MTSDVEAYVRDCQKKSSRVPIPIIASSPNKASYHKRDSILAEKSEQAKVGGVAEIWLFGAYMPDAG